MSDRVLSPSTFDWQSVRRRLADAVAATERAGCLDPARAREMLAARARRLARTETGRPAAVGGRQVLHFSLGEVGYAVETACIRRIARIDATALLPTAGPLLLAIANLRGATVPLVDLPMLLDGRPLGRPEVPFAVVLGRERDELALPADAVTALRRLDDGALARGRDGTCASAIEGLADGRRLLRSGRLLDDPALFFGARHDSQGNGARGG